MEKTLNTTMEPTGRVPERIMKVLAQSRCIRTGVNLLSGVVKHKGIVALADQAVASATNFATGIIIGRSCTKEEFGLYMLGFSIVLFATDIQGSLISTPYMVYSPRLSGRKHRLYTGSTLIHQFGLSALMVILLLGGGLVVSTGIGPSGLAAVVWTLAGVTAFIMLREYARRICFADLQMRTALMIDFCVAIVQISAIGFLAYFGHLSANTAFWVIGAACILAATGWVVSSHEAFTLSFKKAFSDFGHNWSFSKWIFADGLVWVLSMNLYSWVLTAFLGVASAGVWGACLGIAGLGYPVLTGLQNLFGPRMAHSYAAEGLGGLRQCTLRVSVVLSVAMVPFFIGFLFFGDPLVTKVYGAKYTGNGAVMSLLGLNLIVGGVSFAYSRALFAIERADINFKVTTISLFIFFAIGIWLVRSFGPFGAALGLLIANIASSLVRGIIFTRFIGS